MQYIIEKIPIDDVYLNDKIRYNSNNHWKNNIKPNNYNDIIEKSYLNKWIDKFRQYSIITINDKNDIEWIKKVNSVCSNMGRFSSLYEEELDELMIKYEQYNYLFLNNKSYFVRCDNVSLKYSEHGNMPYSNLRDIIKACVTCQNTHTPIYDEMIELKIYLFEWINIDPNLEFRVFVNNNKITAISQQNLYERNQILRAISQKYSMIDEHEHCITRNQCELLELCNEEKRILIEKWINMIKKYFESEIIKKITHILSYSIDITILQNFEGYFPYLIEINSFGKEYSAGSSLFHWMLDESILYGNDEGKIFFRYTQ